MRVKIPFKCKIPTLFTQNGFVNKFSSLRDSHAICHLMNNSPIRQNYTLVYWVPSTSIVGFAGLPVVWLHNVPSRDPCWPLMLLLLPKEEVRWKSVGPLVVSVLTSDGGGMCVWFANTENLLYCSYRENVSACGPVCTGSRAVGREITWKSGEGHVHISILSLQDEKFIFFLNIASVENDLESTFCNVMFLHTMQSQSNEASSCCILKFIDVKNTVN